MKEQKMEMMIRKALPEDASKYTDCVISCWQSAYKKIIPEEYLINMSANKEQWVEKYKESLTNPGDCEYYCVINSERMIGFLIINKSMSDNFWAIYLIEEFCGKGYGKEILDFAINELKCAGHKKICLWVFEENNRARRFYEKYAFSFDGTTRVVDKYGGVPLVQLRYALNL
jgi:RimJ/RimL family protein N-acetyltransferase